MTVSSLLSEIFPTDFWRWLFFRLKIYFVFALVAAWAFLFAGALMAHRSDAAIVMGCVGLLVVAPATIPYLVWTWSSSSAPKGAEVPEDLTAMKEDFDIVVYGPTGAGKTSFIKAALESKLTRNMSGSKFATQGSFARFTELQKTGQDDLRSAFYRLNPHGFVYVLDPSQSTVDLHMFVHNTVTTLQAKRRGEPWHLDSLAVFLNKADEWGRVNSVEMRIREYEQIVERLAAVLEPLGVRTKAYRTSFVHPDDKEFNTQSLSDILSELAEMWIVRTR